MSITHALKWSFLSEIAAKAIQPLVFVVLARLLTPDDYGVVAAAAMVISFSQVFWEAGMGKTIIQYQGDRAAAASVAFWINNALGVVVAGVLVAISGWVADRVFHDPRVALVLQVMALQVFLSASAAVHVALLQKDMQFKYLFWVRLATVAVPGLASIPLAWYGMGYWALVAGALVGQTVQVAILWKTSPWRPRWCFDWGVARQLGRFGGWVAATSLLAWVYLWVDSLILGIYFGAHELGLFRAANQFVILLFGTLFGFLLPVFYSYLSKINNDYRNNNDILNKLLLVSKAVCLISIPVAGSLYLTADDITSFVFGKAWVGVSFIVVLIGIKEAFLWPYAINIEAYRAISKPHLETWIAFLSCIIQPFVLVYAANINFEFFIYARSIFIGIWGVIIHTLFAYFAFGKNGLKIIIPILKLFILFCLFYLFIYLYKLFPIEYLYGQHEYISNYLFLFLLWLVVFAYEKNFIFKLLGIS